MLPVPVRVARRRRELAATWTLDLAPAEPQGRFDFRPGQFNMLYAFGVGEVPISLSGDPERGDRLVHTIRAVGPVSAALAAARPGTTLGLRGPFGRGWPMAEAVGMDVVVVAGGLGLAPLRPALYRLFAERERYGRIVLLVGSRSPSDILFRAELERWRQRLDLDLQVTVDHAAGAWHGHVGVITRLIPSIDVDRAHAIAMVCGPEVMMRFAAAALLQAGLAPEAIYLSMERNMKCAVGFCGHCQFAGSFVCRDGPVFRYDRLAPLLALREI